MASKFADIRTNDEELRIVMVGKLRVGKSITRNTILGGQRFETKFSAISLTMDCSEGNVEVDGQKVSVTDTPGLFDNRFDLQKTVKEISQCFSFAAPGPHVFLVVIRLGRFTEEEKQMVKSIQEMFGNTADKYSMVLFTGGDSLEDTTIEEFVNESADLQELVSRCNGQYHVFNNKLKDHTQVSELIKKIKDIVQKNGGSHYTNEMFQEAERAIEEEKQRILKENEEKRREEIEKLEREIQERYEKQLQKMMEQMQAERERKEREEERKREKEEMEEQRRRERQEMNEERRRDRQEMNEERRRDRQEMEEQRRKDREAMVEERKREREVREAERERQERERENENKMKLLKEEPDRKLNEERKELKSNQEEETRIKAEEEQRRKERKEIEEEMRRFRQELEEQRRRDMQEMNEERRREREAMEEERKRGKQAWTSLGPF